MKWYVSHVFHLLFHYNVTYSKLPQTDSLASLTVFQSWDNSVTSDIWTLTFSSDTERNVCQRSWEMRKTAYLYQISILLISLRGIITLPLHTHTPITSLIDTWNMNTHLHTPYVRKVILMKHFLQSTWLLNSHLGSDECSGLVCVCAGVYWTSRHRFRMCLLIISVLLVLTLNHKDLLEMSLWN